MERVLLLAHTDSDGTLPKPALEALTAARELGHPIVVGLMGADVKAAADGLADCGAEAMLGASIPELAEPRFATDAAAAHALARLSEATIIAAPATSRFSRALPGVAQRLGGRADTGVTAITVDGGKPHIRRWFYRQRMVATLTREHRPWVLLIEPGAFEPWTGPRGSVSLQSVSVELPASRTKVVGTEAAAIGEQTIRPDADLLFVAGAGWTKKQPDGQTHTSEAEALIREFLDKTQASLGSSKSLVDQAGEGQQVLTFPRGWRPAATARSRTSSAGGSSASGGRSTSTPTAGGRTARRMCCTSPTPLRCWRR
jgi:electron transfer flavoprotein alpha subunit